MAEWVREGCDWGRSSLPPASAPQVPFRGCDGYSARIPGQFLAAKVMFLTGFRDCFCLPDN